MPRRAGVCPCVGCLTRTAGSRLAEAGHSVGFRFLELVIAREKPGKRDVKVLQVLQTVSSTMWKAMFGKAADALEKSRDNDDECSILHTAH